MRIGHVGDGCGGAVGSSTSKNRVDVTMPFAVSRLILLVVAPAGTRTTTCASVGVPSGLAETSPNRTSRVDLRLSPEMVT